MQYYCSLYAIAGHVNGMKSVVGLAQSSTTQLYIWQRARNAVSIILKNDQGSHGISQDCTHTPQEVLYLVEIHPR